MDLQELFRICGTITQEKGFDTTQIRTQLALFVTEVAEMLEHVSQSHNEVTDSFSFEISSQSDNYERYRSRVENYFDESIILDKKKFLEELADLQIRIASFIFGNNLEKDFIDALNNKIEVNSTRPRLHGKGF